MPTVQELSAETSLHLAELQAQRDALMEVAADLGRQVRALEAEVAVREQLLASIHSSRKWRLLSRLSHPLRRRPRA